MLTYDDRLFDESTSATMSDSGIVWKAYRSGDNCWTLTERFIAYKDKKGLYFVIREQYERKYLNFFGKLQRVLKEVCCIFADRLECLIWLRENGVLEKGSNIESIVNSVNGET